MTRPISLILGESPPMQAVYSKSVVVAWKRGPWRKTVTNFSSSIEDHGRESKSSGQWPKFYASYMAICHIIKLHIGQFKNTSQSRSKVIIWESALYKMQ